MFSYREDPEKFLAARPDLVIIRPMIDRGYPQFVSRLEKNGITVISLQPQNVEVMFHHQKVGMHRMVGKLNQQFIGFQQNTL